MLTACGSNKDSSSDTVTPDGQTSSTPREEQDENDLFVVEGEVVGLIDNNSFEAIVSGSPVAFRLENAVSVFEEKGINDGDIVRIGYVLNQNEQKIVKTIEKK
jgi:hypothetical protein